MSTHTHTNADELIKTLHVKYATAIASTVYFESERQWTFEHLVEYYTNALTPHFQTSRYDFAIPDVDRLRKIGVLWRRRSTSSLHQNPNAPNFEPVSLNNCNLINIDAYFVALQSAHNLGTGVLARVTQTLAQNSIKEEQLELLPTKLCLHILGTATVPSLPMLQAARSSPPPRLCPPPVDAEGAFTSCSAASWCQGSPAFLDVIQARSRTASTGPPLLPVSEFVFSLLPAKNDCAIHALLHHQSVAHSPYLHATPPEMRPRR